MTAKERRFDGIVCFGGQDWWYHNRGHADIQLMRQFSRRLPVLYVNSIGVRMPRLGEGRMFFTRIGRKLRSVGRGFRTVEPGFAVGSPFTAPAIQRMSLVKRLMAAQVNGQARRMGMKNPLLWVFPPTAAEVTGDIRHVALAYTRFDRYEDFPGVDVPRIVAYDKILKKTADLTSFTSTELFEEGKADCLNPVYVDHGVDYEVFAEAGANPREPDAMKGIPRPRIGFVGGIDRHTFDVRMFCETASRLPRHSFVLVGGCTLPEGWCRLPNVRMLGKCDYKDVPSYMASCDVLIIPYFESGWMRASNPIKAKEYLAVGRPIVTTVLPELKKYGDLILMANDADGFVRAIETALAAPPNADARRARVKGETWEAKSQILLRELEKVNVRPVEK